MVSVRQAACAAFVAALSAGGPLSAQSASITEIASSFSFVLNGTEITVTRTGPSCPSSCVQPIRVSSGVDTLGELEVISFLQTAVSGGSGLLVDVRAPARFSSGSVPGAVNVPLATFLPENPYRSDLLSALGVTNANAAPGFAQAFTLVLFGNGPDDADAPNAIGHLLDAGYPDAKIKYYRGGASTWSTLGLSNSVDQ